MAKGRWGLIKLGGKKVYTLAYANDSREGEYEKYDSKV